MRRRLKMNKMIGFGFLFVTIVLVVVAVTTLIQVARTSQLTTELIHEVEPMEQESVRVLNGVNMSLAALRGWVLINDEAFKLERAASWSGEIKPAIARLKEHIDSSGSSEVDPATLARERIESLSPYEKVMLVEYQLGELEKHQKDIEAIAQSEDNVKANKILLTEAAPQADRVFAAITTMINEEAELEPTQERKQLLTHMANFRGSFAMGLANIRVFLLTGDPVHREQFDTQWAINETALENIEQNNSLLMGAQLAAWNSIRSDRAEFRDLAEKMFISRSAKDWNTAISGLRDNAAPLGSSIRETLESLVEDDLTPLVNQKTIEVEQNEFLLKTIVWSMLILGVVSSGVCGWWITSDFNKLSASIKSLLSDLGTSSQEINAAARQQVASMTESSSSINEISSTAEEFKATIQEFVDRARAVRQAAEEMAKRAGEGVDLTNLTADRNDDVRRSFAATAESILRLSEQMQQITQITTLVNEIAEQTKLLALNASIEAARAGEEGRGFAVVATQVRELANQSKEASSRIASQINDIQSSVQTVIKTSEDGNQKSTDSSQIGQQMAEAFQEIVEAIEQTTDAMSQMDQAARQQESGMADLVTGITEIDSGAKETLTTAEQTQKAIALVERRSQELSEIVSRLKG